MSMIHKYYRRSRISEAKFRQIVKYFAMDLTATQTAQPTGLTRKTANNIFQKIRRRILEECDCQSPFETGEVDESYFGAKHQKGKRGRGASGKTIVFGLLKRDGMVYTEIVPDCSKAALQAIIRGRVSPDMVIHSDGWRGYDGLVDVGYKKHFRVNHGLGEYARGSQHINSIESFWSFAKHRIQKFHGITSAKFNLHL